VVAVVRRLMKQRKESAEQYRAADQEERAATEDAERVVLESYLPPELSEEEIRVVVGKKQQELGLTEKKDTGALMKAVMADLQGQVDGAVVSAIVGEVLA